MGIASLLFPSCELVAEVSFASLLDAFPDELELVLPVLLEVLEEAESPEPDPSSAESELSAEDELDEESELSPEEDASPADSL